MERRRSLARVLWARFPEAPPPCSIGNGRSRRDKFALGMFSCQMMQLTAFRLQGLLTA